ncbi:MAG: hypothetical protein WCI05_09495 [Myxococcales bacterium]
MRREVIVELLERQVRSSAVDRGTSARQGGVIDARRSRRDQAKCDRRPSTEAPRRA